MDKLFYYTNMHYIHILYSNPFYRLCWLDINIWNCYATGRIAKIVIGIEWWCHTYGAYFINATIYSYGSRSKGYSGNFNQSTYYYDCYYFHRFWFWTLLKRSRKIVIAWNCFSLIHICAFFLSCRNCYSSHPLVRLPSKNYWAN